jgi:uncharacterized protein YidB (DUF937 family)
MAKTQPQPGPAPDDPPASTVQGYAGGDPAKAAAVMATMMDLLQQKDGLGGLLAALRQSGLAAEADLQPLADALAARLGLTPDEARRTLAQMVPALVKAADQAGPDSR